MAKLKPIQVKFKDYTALYDWFIAYVLVNNWAMSNIVHFDHNKIHTLKPSSFEGCYGLSVKGFMTTLVKPDILHKYFIVIDSDIIRNCGHDSALLYEEDETHTISETWHGLGYTKATCG